MAELDSIHLIQTLQNRQRPVTKVVILSQIACYLHSVLAVFGRLATWVTDTVLHLSVNSPFMHVRKKAVMNSLSTFYTLHTISAEIPLLLCVAGDQLFICTGFTGKWLRE